MRRQQSQTLGVCQHSLSWTQPLPALSWMLTVTFLPFFYRAVGRTIKMERRVDDDELVKPHPYPPSFCHSSLPWEGCEVAAAFLFLSGEDSQCRNSWGCTWGNGEKAQRSWKLTQEEMCPCGFLEVTGRGLRMQCIIWFVVLSKSIKPQSYILTIYHILVHLISNGNGK